jgi:hypothetical protein
VEKLVSSLCFGNAPSFCYDWAARAFLGVVVSELLALDPEHALTLDPLTQLPPLTLDDQRERQEMAGASFIAAAVGGRGGGGIGGGGGGAPGGGGGGGGRGGGGGGGGGERATMNDKGADDGDAGASGGEGHGASELSHEEMEASWEKAKRQKRARWTKIVGALMIGAVASKAYTVGLCKFNPVDP